ncbi:hypothetical protein GCM10009841_05550 [Microlunatus panaciterrae]|uniref:DUF5941 domain-containing protein n=1 Tax=Microlunatus panaciterrae TaxID=400768 RepID=A0ABS2RIG4_9ACTN|nr:DUF5941 domain-containing protein [Microlunatus panaciterrae]MBM7798790.1 hypothetical protein [Microlunatus panaciterrae]
MPVALVGSEAARAVQGWSAGADLALLADRAGRPAADRSATLSRNLADVGVTGEHVLVRDLGRLAELAARSSDRPLVLAAADLELELPGLLDLLDRPGDATAALVADPQARTTGIAAATPVRVGADAAAIESVGTGWHRVGDPNRISVGLLRVAGRDRPEAARLWLDAAAWAAGRNDDSTGDLPALALLALTRGDLRVRPQELGQVGWARSDISQPGAPGSAWQQRLRNASRGGDGFFSTFVIRPLSRRCTAVALRHDWSPNALTLVSLVVGLLTAALIWSGLPWAWLVAAVTLQLALVIDCMDGEVARFTRRFSAFGAWLDGVGDRVKEYAVFAALAVVAARQGEAQLGWLLALAAMVIVTARHLEDYSFNDKIAPDRASRPDLLPLSERDDGRAPAARTTFPAQQSRSVRIRFWAKKVIHVPIAERYLVLSLGLLTLHPVWVLAAAVATSGFALAWTQGGRLVLALRSPRAAPVRDDRPLPLDQQLDLGGLARLGGRLGRLPFVPGFLLAGLLWLGTITGICLGQLWWPVASAAVAALVVGMACRVPLHHPLAWQALPLIWLAESAVVASLLSVGPVGGAAFVLLAVVAYRRYDLIYSIRLTKVVPSRLATFLGAGADGRILFVTLAVLAVSLGTADPASSLRPVLLAAAGYLVLVYLAESIRQWRAPAPAVRQQPQAQRAT